MTSLDSLTTADWGRLPGHTFGGTGVGTGEVRGKDVAKINAHPIPTAARIVPSPTEMLDVS